MTQLDFMLDWRLINHFYKLQRRVVERMTPALGMTADIPRIPTIIERDMCSDGRLYPSPPIYIAMNPFYYLNLERRLDVSPNLTPFQAMAYIDFTYVHEIGHYFHHLLNPSVFERWMELSEKKKRHSKADNVILREWDEMHKLGEMCADWFAMSYLEMDSKLKNLERWYNPSQVHEAVPKNLIEKWHSILSPGSAIELCRGLMKARDFRDAGDSVQILRRDINETIENIRVREY